MPTTTITTHHSPLGRRAEGRVLSRDEERRSFERDVRALLGEHRDDVLVRTALRLDRAIRRLLWLFRPGR
jgi:hypothetical protein